MKPLKFGKGYVSSSHGLLGLRLLIHTGIKFSMQLVSHALPATFGRYITRAPISIIRCVGIISGRGKIRTQLVISEALFHVKWHDIKLSDVPIEVKRHSEFIIFTRGHIAELWIYLLSLSPSLSLWYIYICIYIYWHLYYSNVTWTLWRPKSRATQLFVQQHVQADGK